jgi:zinc protease
MTPSPGVSIEEAEAAYTKAMDALLRDGITDADVERAKRRMQARIAYAKESPFSVANALGAALAQDQTIEDIESWPDRIAAVTTDQVRSAARKLFTQYSTATGILLPPASLAGAQAASAKGD